MLRYFRYINTLWLIPYLSYFVIPLRFLVKLSPLPVVFFRKSFHVNMMFFFIFVFLYYTIDLKRKNQQRCL